MSNVLVTLLPCLLSSVCELKDDEGMAFFHLSTCSKLAHTFFSVEIGFQMKLEYLIFTFRLINSSGITPEIYHALQRPNKWQKGFP